MKIRLWLLVTMLAFSIHAQADSQRWKDNGNATLTDTFTSLQWTQRDNFSDIDWEGAMHYCDSLSLAGASWRLPTVNELQALYTGGRDGTTQCGDSTCEVSPLFYLTNIIFWSATPAEPYDEGSAQAWFVTLSDGHRYRTPVVSTLTVRALCVRRS